MVQGSTTTVYCYGSFNRLSGYYTTTSCSSPSTSYTYDSNGNMITKTGGWTYSYDYENRLTKVVQSGTTIQTNLYDGDGNRVKQVAGSMTFTYSYQGLSILYEKNVTSGATTITKHFYAEGLQVAKLVGTSLYYLHQDALGSTRLVATSTVTMKFSSNYVPYGPNYAASGKEVFTYTGKPCDSATSLYYYGARFYDGTIGRFVTQDSKAGDKKDPMTMNLYIYARDNPERYVDPTGHGVHVSIMGEANPESETTAVRCSGLVCTETTKITTWDGYALTTSITVGIGAAPGGFVEVMGVSSSSVSQSGATTYSSNTISATYLKTGQLVSPSQIITPLTITVYPNFHSSNTGPCIIPPGYTPTWPSVGVDVGPDGLPLVAIVQTLWDDYNGLAQQYGWPYVPDPMSDPSPGCYTQTPPTTLSVP